MRIEINNWFEYQEFRKGRTKDTLWIKLHTKMLQNYQFSKLIDKDKMTLIELWLITDRATGVIELPEEEILHKIGRKSIQYKELEHFISVSAQDCADLREIAPECGLEKRRVEKRRVEKSREEENDDFDRFWKIYPKKVNKSKSQKAFDKAIKSGVLSSDIISAVESAKESKQWKDDGGKYIPHPLTYLNGERWKDEDYSPETKTGTVPRMEGLGL